MGENDFAVGEKVAWTYMGKDVPGVVKEKSESKVEADSGGKTIKRNGEQDNPAYVLAMDKGDSKDGKEVAKKGSSLHSREDKSSGGDDPSSGKEGGSGSGGGGGGAGAGDGGNGKFISDEVEDVAPAPQEAAEDMQKLEDKVMEEDEAAAGGKAEEEALEEQLEAEDAAAEGEEGAGAAEEEGVLKRKPLDAPTTRDEAAKVAKMGGPATNLRSRE